MELLIQTLSGKAQLPQYATSGSAGMDLCACIDAPLTIPAGGDAVLVPTGLAVAIPEGYVGLIFARSGLAIKHGLAPANCVGVIDSDYRGEVKVGLLNRGTGDYTVQPGERVAQMAVMPVVQPKLVPVPQLPETDRGAGGFGSTGTLGMARPSQN